MTNDLLKTAYLDILKDAPLEYFEARDKRPGGVKGLSGLFLTGVGDKYSTAKNKVMVVGCETAGWEPLVKRIEIPGKLDTYSYPSFNGLENYVDGSMRLQQAHLNNELKPDRKNDRGRTFFNFFRSAAKVADREGLIWANLFCFDWGKGSPIKQFPEFGLIKALSQKLLDKQIEILQPDFIIFANGIAAAKYRREFFPIGVNERCVSSPRSNENIKTHYLWEFRLDKRIKCFRTHHPSARSPLAQVGLNEALKLLAKAIAEKPETNSV
ncbi:MAG: hypothetical protein WBK51_10185 [Polaromonas sp.]